MPDMRARYTQALIAALPPGPAWEGFRESNGVGYRLLETRAGTWSDVEARLSRWNLEYLPWTAVYSLNNREVECGLPDPCTGGAETLEERQARVFARWTARGGQSHAYFKGLAEALGTAIEIEDYTERVFGLSVFQDVDTLQGQFGDWQLNYTWRVTLHDTAVRERVFGTWQIGEPFGVWDSWRAIICLIERYRHPHRVVWWSFME